jgi:hypothetical protein
MSEDHHHGLFETKHEATPPKSEEVPPRVGQALPASTENDTPHTELAPIGNIAGEASVAELLDIMKATEPERWRAYRTDGNTYWIEAGLPNPPEHGDVQEAREAVGISKYTRDTLTRRAGGLESIRASMKAGGFNPTKPVAVGVERAVKAGVSTIHGPELVLDGWSRVVIAHELGIEKIPYRGLVTSMSRVTTP